MKKTAISILFILFTTANLCRATGFTGDFSSPGGAVYDSGSSDSIYGITVDTITIGGPYIYVAGLSSGNFTIKYNASGVMIASATFSTGGSDYGYDVGTDNSGNVFVVDTSYPISGPSIPGIIKYNSALVFQSSATADSNYTSHSLAVDKKSGNVYFSEADMGSTNQYNTIKYRNDLATLASVTFLAPMSSNPSGTAVDNSGNVFVTGFEANPNSNYFILKYDSNLILTTSTVINAGASGISKIAVDNSGNVYGVGTSSGGILTLKYDNNLVFQSSAVFYSGVSDTGNGIAVDNLGRVYVTGALDNMAAMECVTIKYTPNLVFESSTVYIGTGQNDTGYGIAVDNSRNVYVADQSSNGIDYDYRTIRYLPSAFVPNILPLLSWTGEANYASDGLDPETGYSTNTYTFRVEYTDYYNDAPNAGYPKVHIKKSGVEISGSPFAMTYVSGSYTTGAIYTYSTSSLAAGTDYTYYFEAQDVSGINATGTPATPIDAPDVSGPASPPPVVVAPGNVTIVGGSDNRGTINPDKGDTAQIDFHSSEVGKFECRIFTLNGALVFSQTKDNVSSGTFAWIPRNIASGIYIVSVKGPGLNIRKKLAILR